MMPCGQRGGGSDHEFFLLLVFIAIYNIISCSHDDAARETTEKTPRNSVELLNWNDRGGYHRIRGTALHCTLPVLSRALFNKLNCEFLIKVKRSVFYPNLVFWYPDLLSTMNAVVGRLGGVKQTNGDGGKISNITLN